MKSKFLLLAVAVMFSASSYSSAAYSGTCSKMGDNLMSKINENYYGLDSGKYVDSELFGSS